MSEIWAVLESAASLSEQNSELAGEVAEVTRRQSGACTLCAVMLRAPLAEGAEAGVLPSAGAISSAGASPAATSKRVGDKPHLGLGDVATSLDVGWLAALGFRRLYVLEHAALAHYRTGAWVSALAWLIQERAPDLVAASSTRDGRDWTPRLAAQLGLPLVPGCLGVELRDQALFALRPLYEGRAYVQTRTELHGRTAVVTLVPGVRGAPTKAQESASTTASLEIVRLMPEIAEGHGRERIRRVAIQAPSPEEIELDAAERIVAGGRGVGQEGFGMLASFAHQLGAAVGATRVATDLGWIEHARQIGSTGKTVRPRLYIACGISGAAQHTSGMSEAQTVVAINPDRSAPIFALADLGLLGDANQVLPLAAKLLEGTS